VQTFGDMLRQLRASAGLTQGELAKQSNWSQSQISRTEQNLFTPDDVTVQRLDWTLGANGQLITAYTSVRTPNSELACPGRDPLVFSDLMRKIHRTDVGRDTIHQLTVITEQLCCEYVSRRPEELREDAHHQLEYVQRLLAGPTRLSEHRDLLVIAWSFEMSAWFALTQGRLRSVLDYADAGIKAAPHASVAVQLAAQTARAHGRMGNRSEVRHAMDQGFRLLDSHERPIQPENHFVIDPAKWDFYAMDCYRIGGDNTRAAEHAHEVLRLSVRPDGSDRSPMRATEARLTLAIVSLRDGDIDRATDWARTAFQADRKSINSLTMITDELYHEARTQFGDDPAINALNDVIAPFYTSISNR
jgi:transcriptional regulator with XRE-family HTH domain